MERNLDHRIEVIVPVESALVRAEIESVLRSLLADNSQAWELHADGAWERLHPNGAERKRATQVTAMRRRVRVRRSSQAR